MPKKNAKAQKSNELDGAEFFAAINLIEKEKGIPKAYICLLYTSDAADEL